MFRQIFIIASIVALTTAATWFEFGERTNGDRNVYNRTDQTKETELPMKHTIQMQLVGFEYEFTYVRFDVYEGHNEHSVLRLPNGFQLSVSNRNTRHLTVMSTVYGIPNGKNSNLEKIHDKV